MSICTDYRHSEYSLLDGVGSNILYAERAAEMGQSALALTDHGSLAGSLHHLNACREADIAGIAGVEAYYRQNRKVQGIKELRYIYWHIVLLAKDARGWHNLMKITSEAWDSGMYQKPCVDNELLREYHEGLICGTACLGGVLCQRVLDEDSTGADSWLRDLKSVFGDDLFVEIMPSHLPDQVKVNPELVSLANDHSVMVCATCDAHAPYESWTPTQDVLLMINTNQTVKSREEKRAKDEDVFEFNDPTYYLQSEEEVRANFAGHHPQLSQATVDASIANTLEVASRCQPFLVGRYDKLPRFERDRPDMAVLRELVDEGLRRIGREDDAEYVERAEFELGQIEQAKIAAYMLMVRDIVEWAKSDRGYDEKSGGKRPISVGPGRGSVGGSLISYCIGITNIDPIAYRLQFERFYNVNRRGLPDIDVDFPRGRIDEVERYTRQRFGEEHVLDVIAHQTFGPRASIRKVGTALGLPFNEINDACAGIEDTDRSPLEEIRVVNTLVDQIADTYPEAWEHMTRIQGQCQSRSEHAAALLVTPPEYPVRDVIPVERIGGQKGKLITAWGERAGKGGQILSDYGFNKFDWLRVAELDKQDFAVDLIEQRTGERVVLNDLPVHHDPYAVEDEVMHAFGRGLLAGVFQFAGQAARLTRKLKPTNVFDLAAINALIRPGPRGAGMDVDYVARKRGEQEVTYWHPKLEPFLDFTFGLVLYQEQVIEIVHQLGGLSRPESDEFRKIVSKLYRDPEYARSEAGGWRERVFAGFTSNGIESEAGELIWSKLLELSTLYGFNLSHAAGYSLLGYRDEWLKVYYPQEFYAALLSRGLSQIKEKRQQQKEAAIREARAAFGLKVRPPDINESEIDYTVEDDGFRIGLDAIRNVGGVGSKEVIAKRPPEGYASYQDFEQRVEKGRCNIRVKGALVCAGAFDDWGLRDDYTEERIDELEREYLGVSLSTKYSAAAYADVIEPRIHTEDAFDELPDDELVVVAGEVVGMKEHQDSRGGLMCFVDLAYGSENWSITFFSHAYSIYRELLHSHRPIIVRGKKSTYNGRGSVIPLDPEQGSDGTWVHYAQPVEELAQLIRESSPLQPTPA